ncbi:MAG: sigma-70 family RNA polymerase sigma factor [Planctomycetaceae bacterium]|nr:sigma-70 family RNA polymerase sigma factor [Planctomycetaceae bacterium]
MSDELDLIYERVLVVRSQAGDEDAFAELVARYDARLRYFLRKLLGPDRSWTTGLSSRHADDVLQDVWLDVFRHLPRLADPQAFRAWVYRIARDRAFGLLRKSRWAEQPLGETDVPDESDDDDNGFDPEDAKRIHAALDLLPPEQREVLVLRFVEAMSYEGIARVTGQPLGTVRSRLHYAKRALRTILQQQLTEGK